MTETDCKSCRYLSDRPAYRSGVCSFYIVHPYRDQRGAVKIAELDECPSFARYILAVQTAAMERRKGGRDV